MNADWAEVKKLAFDFQRTQAMSSAQKLSERNCVDIVKRLIEMKLIDVIFTIDGKEYITSDHLTREIENELYSSGGRIAISDLVSILNVDYSHIEGKANALVRNSHGEINFILEQLISKEYKDSLTSEIDLHLQEIGTLKVSELSKQYDLPTEFILNMLEERIGLLIKAKLEKETRTLYTIDYLARFESRVQGIFSAITLPVILQTLVNRYSIPEKIFSSTLEKLLNEKRLAGTVSGSTFIPEIYSKNQTDYINSFFKHNRYLEFGTLSKLGISNIPTFLVKKFGSEIIPLDSCAVDRLLFFQIETTLEDCIQNNTFVDLFDIMPSVLSSNDINLLIKKCLENNKQFVQETVILCDTIAVTNTFIEKIKAHFNDVMKKRSDEDLKNGTLLSFFTQNKQTKLSEIDDPKTSLKSIDNFDNDNRKKGKGKKGSSNAGGSYGGGSQGREIKTKAVKKKYKAGKDRYDDKDGEDDNHQKENLKFLEICEIVKIVQAAVSKEKDDTEINDSFYDTLAEYIEDPLKKKYEQIAQDVFLLHNEEANKEKMSFSEMEKFINEHFGKIYMFSKSLEIFDDDLSSKLEKHLQKSLCTDIVNTIVTYFSKEELSNITHESRVKQINKLDNDIRDSLSKLNNSLSRPHVTEFIKELEENSVELDLMIKKIEKKREKNILSEHRKNLIFQLSECKDPILGLHLAVLIIFQVIHDEMLHASGKFVPQILEFIEKDITQELREKFRLSQDNILKFVSSKDQDEKSQIQVQLQQIFKDYQEMVVSFKKLQKS